MKKLFITSIILSSLLLISILLAILTSLTFLSSLRIIFGSVYVLFLPGFIISYIFFPKTKQFEENSKQDEKNKEENGKSIDWIERIALSFALSIAIVPLIIFYLNLIGLKISLLNSFFTILGIIIISFIIFYVRNKRK